MSVPNGPGYRGLVLHGGLSGCALRLASPDSLYSTSLFGFFAVSDYVTLVDVMPRPYIPLSGFYLYFEFSEILCSTYYKTKFQDQ